MAVGTRLSSGLGKRSRSSSLSQIKRNDEQEGAIAATTGQSQSQSQNHPTTITSSFAPAPSPSPICTQNTTTHLFSSPINYAQSTISQIKNVWDSSIITFSINKSPQSTQTTDAPSAFTMDQTTNNSPLPLVSSLPEAMGSPAVNIPAGPSTCSSPLSSDLSEFSRSPTPPNFDYSRDSDEDLSSLSSMSASPTPESSQVENPRPTKRRRISEEPKYDPDQELDLRSEFIPDAQRDQLDRLMKCLRNRRKIVVVAGAGISVSAGSK
jgi:hypothetical protein